MVDQSFEAVIKVMHILGARLEVFLASHAMAGRFVHIKAAAATTEP